MNLENLKAFLTSPERAGLINWRSVEKRAGMPPRSLVDFVNKGHNEDLIEAFMPEIINTLKYVGYDYSVAYDNFL